MGYHDFDVPEEDFSLIEACAKKCLFTPTRLGYYEAKDQVTVHGFREDEDGTRERYAVAFGLLTHVEVVPGMPGLMALSIDIRMTRSSSTQRMVAVK